MRFDGPLPAIRSLLRSGKAGRVAIEVLAQRDAQHVRGIALTPTQGPARGMPVQDTGGPLLAPVGKPILSRMLDVFGNTIDGGPTLAACGRRAMASVHRQPPALVRRSTKSEVFETGIKAIDVLTPLERGGKAGLFGGAGVGKTVLLTEMIDNMVGHQQGVSVCCAIGQRASAVAKAVAKLRDKGALDCTVVVVAEGKDAPGLACIPTKLISITDGQIVMSPSLFGLGVLPAVDVGTSVSRVGSQAQRAAYRAVAGELRLACAQFEELETFAGFGARLDDDTRQSIEHGKRIRACLGQAERSPVSVPAQIAILLALNARLFDPVPLDRMGAAQQAVEARVSAWPDALVRRLNAAEPLCDSDRNRLIDHEDPTQHRRPHPWHRSPVRAGQCLRRTGAGPLRRPHHPGGGAPE